MKMSNGWTERWTDDENILNKSTSSVNDTVKSELHFP